MATLDITARKVEAADDGNRFAVSLVFNGQPLEIEAFYSWETQGNDPEIITIEAAFTDPDGEITHLLELTDWDRSWAMPCYHMTEGWQDPIRIAMFGGRGRVDYGPFADNVWRYNSDYVYPYELKIDWQKYSLGDLIEEKIRESTEFQGRVHSYYSNYFDDGY